MEMVLGRLLKRLGHIAEFHTSVASFKAALKVDLPDLILLDLGLGQENGIDVIHWLAESYPGLSVVLLSGHGDDLLDTARRIAKAAGVVVPGAVSKSRMVAELPRILEKSAAGLPSGLRAEPQSRHHMTRDDLEDVIRMGGIIPYFQPIVSPTDGQLRGAEALARARLPSGRIISAGEFIPLAEASDLIFDLTEVLFERLIESAETLAPLGLKFISVNLSPLILQQERALVMVRRLAAGFAGVCGVKIEMT
jgi:CheY-like chemotaxis protein